MSIKAKVNAAGEIEFELQSPEDIQTLLAAAKNGLVALSTAGMMQTSLQRLRAAYDRIRAQPVQKKVILALGESPDGLTDVELREKVGLDNNNKLGGTMAGIHKTAKAVGLSLEHVLIKRSLAGAKPALYHYRLTPDMLDVVASNKAKRAGS